jgi:hypothetical protein
MASTKSFQMAIKYASKLSFDRRFGRLGRRLLHVLKKIHNELLLRIDGWTVKQIHQVQPDTRTCIYTFSIFIERTYNL